MTDKLRRHTKAGIFIHWFNAVCWFWLLLTGVGLIQNETLRPLGSWYPQLLSDIFGGASNLLVAHWGVGAAWAVVWLVFILLHPRRLVVPFLKDILSFDLPRDAVWMIKKNIQMLVGHRMMAILAAPLGLDGRIPDQGYYNAGQKAAAIPLALGGLALAGTGAIMALSNRILGPEMVAWVQWSITMHYLTAVLTLAVLLIHIFMAGISRDERPALFSMFTGDVPSDYAEHHHRLWYEAVIKAGRTGREEKSLV